MAVFQKFDSFVEAVAEGKHDFSADTLTRALTAAANPPLVTNGALSDLTEIAYTFLSSRVLTLSAGGSAQVGGLYTLKLDDLTLTASGGSVAPFQYVVVYNSSAPLGSELVGFYSYGSDLTLAAGESLQVNFDDANGVLTIT